jgi:hypothetical protein
MKLELLVQFLHWARKASEPYFTNLKFRGFGFISVDFLRFCILTIHTSLQPLGGISLCHRISRILSLLVVALLVG